VTHFAARRLLATTCIRGKNGTKIKRYRKKERSQNGRKGRKTKTKTNEGAVIKERETRRNDSEIKKQKEKESETNGRKKCMIEGKKEGKKERKEKVRAFSSGQCGAIPSLPQYASWRGAQLKKHRDNFTFTFTRAALSHSAAMEYSIIDMVLSRASTS
jgi:hypothetical protein